LRAIAGAIAVKRDIAQVAYAGDIETGIPVIRDDRSQACAIQSDRGAVKAIGYLANELAASACAIALASVAVMTPRSRRTRLPGKPSPSSPTGPTGILENIQAVEV
jgi:hypothetical protein